MTFTPRDAALPWMAAPGAEPRFTSRSTFAPFVMSCSACCCWVDLSPWALSIVTRTPADLNAACSSGGCNDSQRTAYLVSGSRPPPFWALLPLVLLAPPPLGDVLLLLSEPH